MKVKLYDMVKARSRRDDEEDWLPILVIHLMTEHTNDASNWDKVFNLRPLKPGNGEDQQEIDLRIMINGVEVRFETFVKELQRQYCSMLEAQAKEMISKRCQKLLDLVEEAGRLIDDEIENDFPGRKVW